MNFKLSSRNTIFVSFLVLIFSSMLNAQSIEIQSNNNRIFLIKKNSLATVQIIPSINYGSQFPDYSQNPPKQSVDNINVFNWVLKFTASGKVFKDISFATPQVGYIVTELGAVYKSINGGDNWTNVMNLGFPYYWYGVHALSSDTVVIAGFNNQGNIHSGVVRWSFNGGVTWTNDIILTVPSNGVGWLTRVHFFDQNKGIVSNEFSGGIYYTSNGGKDSTAWHYVQVNSDLGWFAGNIDADASGNVFTTGIHFAHSTNFGMNWTSGPSVDYVFDGGVDFIDNNLQKGMTGGGQISNPVSGWTHLTTNGGQNWSDRQLTFPYPIRSVKFFNDTLAIAIGGNLYQDAGGIYSTTNDGINWNLDISTSAEMFSYDYKLLSADSMDIWCVGSTGGTSGFTGKLYKARAGNIVGLNVSHNNLPYQFQLFQNYPNPFNPGTNINYQLSSTENVRLIIYDILGNMLVVLVNKKQDPGTYNIYFDGSKYPSGIYFYKLIAGKFTDTKKMILIK